MYAVKIWLTLVHSIKSYDGPKKVLLSHPVYCSEGNIYLKKQNHSVLPDKPLWHWQFVTIRIPNKFVTGDEELPTKIFQDNVRFHFGLFGRSQRRAMFDWNLNTQHWLIHIDNIVQFQRQVTYKVGQRKLSSSC